MRKRGTAVRLSLFLFQFYSAHFPMPKGRGCQRQALSSIPSPYISIPTHLPTHPSTYIPTCLTMPILSHPIPSIHTYLSGHSITLPFLPPDHSHHLTIPASWRAPRDYTRNGELLGKKLVHSLCTSPPRGGGPRE